MTNEMKPTLQDNRVYVRTYFRINTPSYGVNGFEDQEQREQFYKDVTDVLATLGFEIFPPKFSGSCPEAIRGVERLYCHPQDISGYVTEESIDQITTAIESAETFKLRWVDKYESVYNYTADEFQSALEEMRDEITARIKERFKTKRRNLYVYGSALSGVSSGLKIFRNGVVGTAPLERPESEFIRRIFDEQVAQGEIVTAEKDGRTLYRTRSHRDPKKVA